MAYHRPARAAPAGRPRYPNNQAVVVPGGSDMIVRQSPFLWRLAAFVLLMALAASQLMPVRGAPRSGRALYVAENGSDTGNNGLSLAAPFRTIQRCAQVAAAGDTCFIRAGTYRET